MQRITSLLSKREFSTNTDNLWDLLLKLKEIVYSNPGNKHQTIWVSNEVVSFDNIPDNKNGFLIIFDDEHQKANVPTVKISTSGSTFFENFEKGSVFDRDVLELYLPFCLAPILRKKKRMPLSITHFAQTLDGYIATLSNHSKWIGNDENLIHAHRLRAMVDAVVIGNNTLVCDAPKLTVRHVKGKNPTRVVIGNSNKKLDSLITEDSANSKKVIRVISSQNKMEGNCVYDCLRVKSESYRMPTQNILEALYEKGIYSILIEGGASTSSCFLEEGNIDMLQLHISPMLFGSGVKTFTLPEIKEVGDAKQFEKSFYSKMGDGMMFTGFLKKEGK